MNRAGSVTTVQVKLTSVLKN